MDDARIDQNQQAELVERWARDPEVAKAALRQLMPLVDSSDTSIQGWAVEALENCGPPLPSDLQWLVDQLRCESGDIVYWAATLIGRLGMVAIEHQLPLAHVLDDPNAAPQGKTRAAWALGRLGPLDSSVRTSLERAARDTTNPRLGAVAALALEGKT
jgi:hypothetical protein